jgi:hypothetical protein
MTWVQSWLVPSSSGDKNYTVSIDEKGDYACSCVGWTSHFPRRDCKHCRLIRTQNENPNPGAVKLPPAKATSKQQVPKKPQKGADIGGWIDV